MTVFIIKKDILCKHIVGVLECFKCWDKLSKHYLNSPFLTLDNKVLDDSIENSCEYDDITLSSVNETSIFFTTITENKANLHLLRSDNSLRKQKDENEMFGVSENVSTKYYFPFKRSR